MDRVGATIATQTVATSTTSPAPGTSTAPTPSELAASGKNVPSYYQFVTSDSDADSNGIPQILSEDETTGTTPPASSDQPPSRKVVLKRKLKKKASKAKGEDKATVKVPKIKKKKKADATKSSAKVRKLIVKLPLSQSLPFSQQLQTLATSKQSTSSETTRRGRQ